VPVSFSDEVLGNSQRTTFLPFTSSSRLPAASPVASRISWGPLYSKLAPALSKIAPTNSGGYKRVFCDRIPGCGRSPFAVGSSVQAMLNPAGVLLSQTIHTSYNATPGRRSLFAPAGDDPLQQERNNHHRQPFSPKGRRLPCRLRFNTRLNGSAL
jgi:hypothetical protein